MKDPLLDSAEKYTGKGQQKAAPKVEPTKEPVSDSGLKFVKRLNPFSLERPPTKTVTKTLKDPDMGIETQITLKSLDQAEAVKCIEVSEFYIKKYLGDDRNRPEQAFPVIGDKRVEMSRALIQSAVVLSKQQVVDNEEDRYRVEDFIAMSVTAPVIWQQLFLVMEELQSKQDDEPKNDWLVDTGP